MVTAAITAGAMLAKGLFDAHNASKAASTRQNNINTARTTINNSKNETNRYYDQMANEVADYHAKRGSLGTADDVNTYRELIEKYNPNDYVLSEDQLKYNYDKTVDDFVNPYYDKIIQGTVNSLSHSAAGNGGSRGTGALANIATGVAQKQDELYKTALNEYNTDRAQDYKEFSDYTTNMQNRLNTLNQNNQYLASLYGTNAKAYLDDQDQAMQDMLKIQQDKVSANTQYATSMAGLV